MDVSKIVITGGPCAGKTTAMRRIQAAFLPMGYAVLIVPEAATELMTGGVTPWSCTSKRDFQQLRLKLQADKEQIFASAATLMDAEKVLIVCDRGIMDGKAYMDAADFNADLQRAGMNEIEARDTYDAVFHLVTAANGAEAFYTNANNPIRTETPEEARVLDDRLIAAWTGHPHLRVIGNDAGFEEKMDRLILEIALFLGEPVPREIERKFLIAYPDLARLEREPCCERVEIIQTYLYAADGAEARVRQRGANGNYVFFHTEKRKIDAVKRIETEQRITREQYVRYLMDADTSLHPIRKTRYCLMYRNQYFEIDLYPFWKEQAVLEIELLNESAPIEFPDFLHIRREVTGDDAFKNRALAALGEG